MAQLNLAWKLPVRSLLRLAHSLLHTLHRALSLALGWTRIWALLRRAPLPAEETHRFFRAFDRWFSKSWTGLQNHGLLLRLRLPDQY